VGAGTSGLNGKNTAITASPDDQRDTQSSLSSSSTVFHDKDGGLIGAVAAALKTYRERLQYLTTAVDSNLFHRIRPVIELPDLDTGVPVPMPVLDMLVIDVYIDNHGSMHSSVTKPHQQPGQSAQIPEPRTEREVNLAMTSTTRIDTSRSTTSNGKDLPSSRASISRQGTASSTSGPSVGAPGSKYG
jgi:hypothetical protein